LKALRDKRGYQLNRIESMRLSYLQDKQQAATVIKKITGQFRGDSLMPQIDELKRFTQERFDDWDKQLVIFSTLPTEEANLKIREYILKNLPVAERWEDRLVAIQKVLHIRTDHLSQQLDQLSYQINISFIMLLLLVMGLLTWSYFSIRKQDYLKERTESAMRINSAIRASQQEFSSAFEYASIGMALVGLDGRFNKVNNSLCKLLGYSAKE
jgi:PAS domain-containing protein